MRSAFFLIVLAVTGCASAPTPVPADEDVVVGRLIAETLGAMRAPSSDQRRHVAVAENAYAARPDDAGSLQLALLLAHLPPPLRDEDRALSLVAPVQARPSTAPLARLATLLGEQLQERQRLALEHAERLRRENARRQATEEREQELRHRLDALRALETREAALVRRQAEALRAGEQREGVLRRQIEGLRTAERELLDREEKLGRGRR